MVETFRSVIESASETPHPAVTDLRDLIGFDEHLRQFGQASSVNGPELGQVGPVLVIETDQRLALVDADGCTVEEHSISEVEAGEDEMRERSWFSLSTLTKPNQPTMYMVTTIRASGLDRVFTEIIPGEVPLRLKRRLGGEDVEIVPGVRSVPDTPEIARFHSALLHLDRLEVPDDALGGRRQCLFDGEVTAHVDTAGNLAKTRSRNLADKTVGVAFFGPLGLLAGGPKDHITDTRELYVLVEGSDWAWSETATPALEDGYTARRFAQLVNVVARLSGQGTALSHDQPDYIAELRALGELRDEGVLTEAEFADRKAHILRRASGSS
jgi:hypothetical protein